MASVVGYIAVVEEIDQTKFAVVELVVLILPVEEVEQDHVLPEVEVAHHHHYLEFFGYSYPLVVAYCYFYVVVMVEQDHV